MTTTVRTPERSTSPHSRPSRPGRGSRALAVSGAVAATAVLWLATALLGIDLHIDPSNGGPVTIGLPIVVGSTLAISLIGWLTLALLERLTHKAHAIWTTLALTVLTVSFLPFWSAEANTATICSLALMHLAVAAVLIPTLPRTRRP